MNLTCDTQTFKKIAAMDGKIRVSQGGSSAAKTYSILQLLVANAILSEERKIVTIVTDTYPNLKGGAWQDFCDIASGIITQPKNIADIEIFDWKFQFIALDKPSKALGGRRDILFLNEANRMEWETARHLIIRTRDCVFIDYNPDRRFWVHENYLERERADLVTVTYKDNKYVPQMAIDEIEAYKENDPEWYKVYGLGQLGDIQGSLFKGLQTFTGDVEGITITSTDPKDTGTDNWASVQGVVSGGLVYITEVVYTNQQSDVAMPRLVEMINRNKSGKNYIETNLGGSFLLSAVAKETAHDVLSIKNQTNKLTRIINEARFIKRFFRFRSDGNAEYNRFLNDVKFYTEDKKQPDDAPDALAMLSVIVQTLFYHEFYHR